MACFSSLRWRASRAQVMPEQVPESAFRVRLEVELLKEETWRGWGIVVSSDEAIQELVIVAIQQSSTVKNWNLEHPECPIEVGQAILEVNGKTQRNEMLQELWDEKDGKDGKEGKVSLEMLLDVQLTPRQRSFFKGAIQRYDAVGDFLESAHLSHDLCVAEPCPICHDPVHGSSDVVRLPCGHHFHKHCAFKWFVSQRKFRCPTCNNLLGGWS
ncbi:unnamed protein product [Durusdinium trenchii]|uniref:Uncharacterized protein n=2 Tax=Durusdinium trenchii TaxID=1381693 RepID=A0ABP0MZ25_9DINO